MYFNTLAKKQTTNKPQLNNYLQKTARFSEQKMWYYATKWGMTYTQNSHSA